MMNSPALLSVVNYNIGNTMRAERVPCERSEYPATEGSTLRAQRVPYEAQAEYPSSVASIPRPKGVNNKKKSPTIVRLWL